MNISGTTRVFLILGDPVAQVRAPEAFNHLFARHGADAVLVPANVPAAELEGFVRHVLKARNIDGLWLAIPHKTPMVGLLDRCDRLGSAVLPAQHRQSGLVQALDTQGDAVDAGGAEGG